MKKITALVIAFAISGGLVFAKYSGESNYAANTDQIGLQSSSSVELNNVIEEVLAGEMLVAQLEQQVALDREIITREMNAAIEAQLDKQASLLALAY